MHLAFLPRVWSAYNEKERKSLVRVPMRISFTFLFTFESRCLSLNFATADLVSSGERNTMLHRGFGLRKRQRENFYGALSAGTEVERLSVLCGQVTGTAIRKTMGSPNGGIVDLWWNKWDTRCIEAPGRSFPYSWFNMPPSRCPHESRCRLGLNSSCKGVWGRKTRQIYPLKKLSQELKIKKRPTWAPRGRLPFHFMTQTPRLQSNVRGWDCACRTLHTMYRTGLCYCTGFSWILVKFASNPSQICRVWSINIWFCICIWSIILPEWLKMSHGYIFIPRPW